MMERELIMKDKGSCDKKESLGKRYTLRAGLLDLIFQPGFSSAEKVTEVSGRGVGLDIVKTQLKR